MDNILKHLKETELIPDAWERWAKYRGEVTDYILKVAGEIKVDESCESENASRECMRKKIAIYGAGRCDDIDVRRLIDAGYDVTLYDCDVNAMREAAEKKEYIDEVSLKYINVFNVREDDYDELEYLLRGGEENSDSAGVDSARVVELFESILEREMEDFFAVPTEKYDLNVVIGLHSQILVKLMCFLSIFNAEHPDIVSMIDDMNYHMVERFHDEMFRSRKGNFIVGYEYSTFPSGEASEIKEMFLAGKKAEIDKLGLSRVKGAIEAEADLNKRFGEQEIDIRSFEYSVWNILEYKEYLMVMYHVVG